jgi:hypothetical protein
MLDKIHLKEIVSYLAIRISKVFYFGEMDKCPFVLLSRKDIIIKRLEGKGQGYECNSRNPKILQKGWRREKCDNRGTYHVL